MSDFYLTLPSNSSMDYFPDNTMTRYTTKLPKRIQLEGDWEVGLAEIQYTRLWFNIPFKSDRRFYLRQRTDDMTDPEKKEWESFTFDMGHGYFSKLPVLLGELNARIKSETKRDDVFFSYKRHSKTVLVVIPVDVEMQIPPGLRDMFKLLNSFMYGKPTKKKKKSRMNAKMTQPRRKSKATDM